MSASLRAPPPPSCAHEPPGGAAPAGQLAPAEEMPGERVNMKIADLGNATWIEHHFTDDIQTRQYRCPEVILGAKWVRPPTFGALPIFELITGGDYLFDPASGSRYSKDDDHIAQIIELVGDFPKSIAFSGKFSGEFFNRRGELRHITKLRLWPLEDVLHDKYLLPRTDALVIASFLGPMLRLHPEKCARAVELREHQFLAGVTVGPVSPLPGAREEGLKPVEDQRVSEEDRRRADALHAHHSSSVKDGGPQHHLHAERPHEERRSAGESITPSRAERKERKQKRAAAALD